ncbi:MAG TPA: dehydrogenase [Clostridiales bacterium]|nr:dehydrogenase [Clostridiales bacterium]
MEKTLNIGLVGYKFMGKAHSNAYARLGMFFNTSAKVRMKALCGRDPEWLAQAAQKFGWEGYETSWENLVIRNDIDVVDITTPSNFHKEIAIAAAENGKHVFCEKPLALTLKDARDMQACAAKNGVKNQIGFNYRFAPAIQLAKNMIDGGKLGKIFHFRGTYLQDWIIDPEFPLVWRLDKKVAGSGSHGDLGAHLIDMAHYLVGDLSRVIGISKTFVTERPLVERMTGLSGKAQADAPRGAVEVDDATLFLGEFKSGGLCSIEATRFASGHKNAMSFEVNGSKGSIKFEFERMNELQYFNAEDEAGTQGFRLIQASEGIHPYVSAWWPAGHVLGYEHTFVHEMYEFVEAIAQDKPTCPDFSDGVKCSRVLEAVELSITERQWVEVDSL